MQADEVLAVNKASMEKRTGRNHELKALQEEMDSDTPERIAIIVCRRAFHELFMLNKF